MKSKNKNKSLKKVACISGTPLLAMMLWTLPVGLESSAKEDSGVTLTKQDIINSKLTMITKETTGVYDRLVKELFPKKLVKVSNKDASKNKTKRANKNTTQDKELQTLVKTVIKNYKPKEKIKTSFETVRKSRIVSSESGRTLNKAEELSRSIAQELGQLRSSAVVYTKKNDIEDSNSSQLQSLAVTQENIESLKDLKELYNKTGFQGYNVSSYTGLTASQMDKGLSGTGLHGMGAYFISAEKEYKVSALALAGIAANESAWGTSRFAKTRYNYFGYQAYDSNTDKARYFKSPKESVDVAAYLLANSYLTPSGPYYNGLTLQSINVKYASDPDWAEKAMSNMGKILNKIY